jgi:F-type H+-transporting ATPase subunit delta
MEAIGNYLVRTYAAVLFELADETSALQTVKDDFDSWTGICGAGKGFEEFIVSPYFPSEYKQHLIDKMLSGKISRLTMDFLRVVIKRNRTKFLPRIIAEYNKLWEARAGFCSVEVTVAKQINDDEVQKLAGNIASMIDRKVKLKLAINPEILGGVIIRYDDKVIDNTIKSRLHRAVETIIKHGKGREINEV